MRFALVALLLVACKGRPPATAVPAPVVEPAPASIDGTPYLPKVATPYGLPPGAPKDLFDRSRVAAIRIYATEAEVASRVTNPADLGTFLEIAQYIAQMTLGMSQKKVDVTIRFDCTVGKHAVKIDSKDALDPTLVSYLEEDLGGLPPLAVTGDLSFEIAVQVHDPRVYENPLDGKRYVADWHTYKPQGGTPPDDPNKKVKLESVRLLTAQADIAKRMTVEDMAAFVKALEAHAAVTVGTAGKAGELMLQLKFTPTGHTVQIAVKGDLDNAVVQKLHDAIVATKSPRSTGDVEILLHFTVRP